MSKIDRQASKRITAYLRERVSDREGPRTVERSLHEPLAGLWRYRVGDFRIIWKIEDAQLVVLVGHHRTSRRNLSQMIRKS